MDLIEAVFVNQGVPKLLVRKNDKWLMVNLNGRLTAWKRYYPIPDIGRPIPADQFDRATVPKGYDVWLFYSHANKVLNAAQPVNGLFAGQVMT